MVQRQSRRMVQVISPSGALYLYTYLQSGSIILNQRFGEEGLLVKELIGSWEQPLDTVHLLPTRVALKSGLDSLIAGGAKYTGHGAWGSDHPGSVCDPRWYSGAASTMMNSLVSRHYS